MLSDSALFKPALVCSNLDIMNHVGQQDSSSFGNNVESIIQDIDRDSRGHANTGTGMYQGLAADDVLSQTSGLYTDLKKDLFYRTHQRSNERSLQAAKIMGSPTSLGGPKTPLLNKDIVQAICLSKRLGSSLTSTHGHHYRTDSRNTNNEIIQSMYYENLQHHNTQRNPNNMMEFTQIDTCAHRPCCKGKKSYIASHHQSLNMSRQVSRRESRNGILSSNLQKLTTL